MGRFHPILFSLLLLSGHVCAQKADLLVVNKGKINGNLPGKLAFVHLASGKVLKQIPVGKEPHEVAVSADGRYAVVSNTGSYQQPGHTLSVIDLATQQEVHRMELGSLYNPHGLLALHGVFYFTAEGARAIGAYDPVKNQVVWLNGTGQDGTHTLAATPDGKSLVATNRGSGTISIFQLRKPHRGPVPANGPEEEKLDPLAPGVWQEAIVTVGKNPEGLAISPDGTQAWIGLKGGEGIAVVDLRTNNVAVFKVGEVEQLSRLKFTQDGRYLLGTNNNMDGELVIVEVATRQLVKKLALGTGAEAIFLEPDGRHALIGVTGKDQVAEIDLRTMTVSRRFDAGQGPDGMAWIGN